MQRNSFLRLIFSVVGCSEESVLSRVQKQTEGEIIVSAARTPGGEEHQEHLQELNVQQQKQVFWWLEFLPQMLNAGLKHRMTT